MIATASDNLLGIGLYTPQEAAFYARIHTRVMNRWLYGDGHGEPVIEPQRGRTEKHVSFLDFVQALAIRAITRGPSNAKVTLPKIREAVNEAKSRYGVDYPFAMEHTTYLFGSDVIIRLADDDYRPLTGKTKGNMMITEVVETYKQRLGFSSHGLANLYSAWGTGQDEITLNPKTHFGEPAFPKYGYTAHTLWQAVSTEGSVALAAKAYGVPESAILSACDYFDHLQGRNAA